MLLNLFPFYDWRYRYAAHIMRHRSDSLLAARLKALDFCRTSYAYQKYDLLPESNISDAPIWQYWGQGSEYAPPLVKECLRSVAMYSQDRIVIVLTDATLNDYLKIPDAVMRIQSTHRTLFSDYVRVALLSKYGGTWIDATVLLTAPIHSKILKNPFFVFSRPADPFLLSSWFMHAVKQHPLCIHLQGVLEAYWQEHQEALDYFMLHFFFEALVTSQKDLGHLWQQMPRWSAYPSHEMQSMLHEKIHAADLKSCLARTSVHKLTYKMDAPKGAEQTLWDLFQNGTIQTCLDVYRTKTA